MSAAGPLTDPASVSCGTTGPQVGDRTSRLWLWVGLFLTALVYAATLGFTFVHDDWVQLVRNPRLLSWRFVPQFFIEHTWKFLAPNAPGNYYRPLFMVWLWLNRAIFGLNPVWWHATTVALHLVVTVLVYRLATRLTHSAVQGAIAALFFGLNPVHIEAVAWIAGVTEPLMAAFVVGSVICWVRWRQQTCTTAYYGSLALYAAGMLSKETAFLVPIILVAYEWSVGRDRLWNRIKDLWPFAVLAVAYLVVRTAVLQGVAHGDAKAGLQALLTLPSVLWFYILHSIWPFGLSLFYSLDWIHSAAQGQFWMPLCSVLATIALCVFAAKRSRLFGFAAIWFAVFLIPPILGLATFIRGDLVHDRYLYLPSVAVCLLAAMALSKISAGKKLLGLPAVRAIAVLALACVLAASTSGQELQWRNDLAVFSHSVAASPNNPLAKDLLANELYKRQRPDEAIELYRESVEIDPSNWKTFLAAGVTCYEVGRFREADQYLSRAIEMEPTDSNQFFYRGLTRLQLGQDAEAESDFRATLQRASAPGIHYWLGISLDKQGKTNEARQQFSEELKLGPSPQAEQKLKELEGK